MLRDKIKILILEAKLRVNDNNAHELAKSLGVPNEEINCKNNINNQWINDLEIALQDEQ